MADASGNFPPSPLLRRTNLPGNYALVTLPTTEQTVERNKASQRARLRGGSRKSRRSRRSRRSHRSRRSRK